MKNILRTVPAKIVIYMMTCIMMITTLLSVAVGIGCYETKLYEKTPEELLDKEAANIARNASDIIFADIRNWLTEDGELKYGELKSEDVMIDEYEWVTGIPDNIMYSVTDANGKCVLESDGFDKSKTKYTYYFSFKNAEKDDTVENEIVDDENAENEKVVEVNIDDDQNVVLAINKESELNNNIKRVTYSAYYEGNDGLPEISYFNNRAKVYKLLYKYRNDVLPIGIISVIMSFVFYITMICVSARRPKSEDLHPGYFNKIPFDVLFAAALCLGGFFVLVADAVNSDDIAIVIVGAALVCAIFVFNGLSMSVAARIKQGTLLANTLIFMLCKWCWKIFKKYVIGLIKWCWNKFIGMFCAVGEVFHKLPLIWKTAALFCGISLLDLIAFAACCDNNEWDMYFLFWLIMHVVLFVLVCRFTLGLRGLQAGGRALAAGDFEHKVDTSKLHADFKEHGENLNHISDGMISAVEEKMKSERMKTELITNVSHDIKTPLTSIINYTDLIGKEETDNEKIKEYTEVLLRQSERLKRLIEDLVEASKASTGNLEVELASCEASMFITQIAGEYEEKLNASGLTLVTKINSGSDGAMIMADGRRMLRVFDNLMNNICKYALENSRVYLSLDVDSNVVITFKNTSRTELDMSPDELMERFVRGDASRNTEGNGLGLSIARSLTELQGGTFDIMIDGDLFKVVLTFPVKE